MSLRRFAAALAVLGAFGASQAMAATPHCGVFTEDSGTVTVVNELAHYSNSQLYNEGRFSASGPQFGCWIDVGTSDQLRSTMMYSYRFTDPKGQSYDQGPFGIQSGGFGSGRIPTYTASGAWRVEFFLVSRADGAKSSIGSIAITMAP
jgi:hypothetical protein